MISRIPTRKPLLSERVAIDEAGSAAMIDWCEQQYVSQASGFEAERSIARRLGALPTDDGSVSFGFWAPELLDHRVPDGDVFLELLAPRRPSTWSVRSRPWSSSGSCCPWSATRRWFLPWCPACAPGTAKRVGDLYALCWRDSSGASTASATPWPPPCPSGPSRRRRVLDKTACTGTGRRSPTTATWPRVPRRARLPRTSSRIPANILQVHVPTATAGGTLASLARHFERIAERLRNDLPLEEGDELYMGYDAVQLLPVEPTTVYEKGPSFWQEGGATATTCASICCGPTRRTGATTW
jgi:hypothetical protein